MQSTLSPNEGTVGWNFDNSYSRLPESLFVRLSPVPVRSPAPVILNRPLAEFLGLNAEALLGDEGVAVFSGNVIPEGSTPLAQAYTGHQFGHFTMLGDGRAILLGEQITPSGERFDIQLKGSGQTPFSRQGDGRAALGPMLREYIISEALHALKIPTSRSLAVVTTGEPVYRETTLPGAILTRVASSHLRVGTFQYLAASGKIDDLRVLVDYTLDRHFPERASADNPGLALLQEVMKRQATLVAQWQLVGFIHGVMNTDNTALSGETIDYGPCAFMDAYDPSTVFSSIDHQGRYAYGNQPGIAQWNIARFAEALVPLLHDDQEQALALGREAVDAFPELFGKAWMTGMRSKLGLFNEEEADETLAGDLLAAMHRRHADFTNTFRDLAPEPTVENHFFRTTEFAQWHEQWAARLNRQDEPIQAALKLMQTSNPAVIPRNHRVEAALKAAEEQNDLTVLTQLLKILSTPYDDGPEKSDYRTPPPPSSDPYRTFCGT